MEFKEYSNPEGADYDLTANENEENNLVEDNVNKSNPIKTKFDELWCDLGMPEFSELEPYGISVAEFDNPGVDTLRKLQEYALVIEEKKKGNKIR